MKKLILAMLMVLVLIVPVFAAGDTIQNAEKKANGTDTLIASAHAQAAEGKNISAIRADIIAKRQELKSEIKETKAAQKTIRENQNEIRVAVHALLAVENRTGGIGKNVSAIAREFSNDVDKSEKAELKIQNRGRMVKRFFGGDSNSANAISQVVARDEERIAKLKALEAKCTECNADTITLINEQITAIEAQNTRLQALATTEKETKGLFKRK